MRTVAILLALATVAGAGENLLPREGSGWTGFEPDSRVKLKQTVIASRGAPSVTITEMRLVDSGKSKLCYSVKTKTALGVDNQSNLIYVPKSGEANLEEKVTESKPETVEIEAGGKTFRCTKRSFTMSSPTGKRVVTNWESAEPQVRIKRTELQFDPKGKQTQSFSMLLKSLDEKRKVSGKEIRCLEYNTLLVAGKMEQTGTALLSREVPGGTVRMDFDRLIDGVKQFAVRLEVVSFKAKIGSQ
jgi:hypothetical protein